MNEKFNEEDDEIKILGSGRMSLNDIVHDKEILVNSVGSENKAMPKAGLSKTVIISLFCLLTAVVLVGVAAFLSYSGYYRAQITVDVSRSTEQIIEAIANGMPSGKPSVTMEVTSINGVKFRLYTLKNLTMSVEHRYPDDSDSSIYFVSRAMDYRKDMDDIIGEYVVNGEKRGRSRKRVAYLASVPGRLPQIGIGNDDDIVDYIVESEGNLVRQFALVSSGQIYTSQFALKGKVTREAYASKITDPSTLYFIESLTDESMYDFAEAIVDMGFTDAIYITDGLWPSRFYRGEDKQVMDSTTYSFKKHARQYLVFRGK